MNFNNNIDCPNENQSLLSVKQLPEINIEGSNSQSSIISMDSSDIILNKESDESKSVDLIWRNVGYTVTDNNIKSKSKTIEIIRNANGKGLNGKLTVLLGPSGAGKTTLLECIAGRRAEGLSGDIYVTGGQRTRISFCGQKDDHLDQLTVRETLLFASRLKNYDRNKKLCKRWTNMAHNEIVDNILKQLGLNSCANVRVGSCSGGQRKRLSIGSELVSRPNILLLDEPTSGLDSSSCMQCVKLMLDLSRGHQSDPMVVIASLHQPSSQVLNLIDYLYILSKGGTSIYYGPTKELTSYISNYNISCPMFRTPTDIAIEIASGDYGLEMIEKMAYHQMKESGFYEAKSLHCERVSKIIAKTKRQSHPFALHSWLLFVRTNIIAWRQPQLTTLRLFTSISIALMISFIYNNKVGQFSGCVSSSLANFKLTDFAGDATSNLGYIFFTLLFISLSSKMPTILTFPLEMSVFLKERANGWYSCGTYYIAKSMADLPYQIIFPLIYCSISYFATYQILDIWRMAIFFAVNIILAFISQTVGLLIGTIFANDLTSAVYAVALVTAPLILFTGFLVPFTQMPEYLHPITYVSWVRFAMESILIALYGYDRCDRSVRALQSTPTSLPTALDMNKFVELAQYLNEKNLMAEAIWLLNSNITSQIKEGQSFILTAFQLQDSQLLFNICSLLAVMLVLRFIAYFVLLWKVNRIY